VVKRTGAPNASEEMIDAQRAVLAYDGGTGERSSTMSRIIKMSLPTTKKTEAPKTAALTKAQAEHVKWLKAHGIKITRNTLRS
jgi:hypothetical protein